MQACLNVCNATQHSTEAAMRFDVHMGKITLFLKQLTKKREENEKKCHSISKMDRTLHDM